MLSKFLLLKMKGAMLAVGEAAETRVIVAFLVVVEGVYFFVCFVFSRYK